MVETLQRHTCQPRLFRKTIPEDGVFPQLSQLDLYTLFLTARGLRETDIAGLRGIKERTVKNQKQVIFTKLGVNSSIEAILYFLKKGTFRLDDLARDFNLEAAEDLTTREIHILRLMTESNGINSSDKKIAESLGRSIDTVKNHFGNIFDKLGTRSRTRAVITLLAAEEAGIVPTPNSSHS